MTRQTLLPAMAPKLFCTEAVNEVISVPKTDSFGIAAAEQFAACLLIEEAVPKAGKSNEHVKRRGSIMGDKRRRGKRRKRERCKDRSLRNTYPSLP